MGGVIGRWSISGRLQRSRAWWRCTLSAVGLALACTQMYVDSPGSARHLVEPFAKRLRRSHHQSCEGKDSHRKWSIISSLCSWGCRRRALMCLLIMGNTINLSSLLSILLAVSVRPLVICSVDLSSSWVANYEELLVPRWESPFQIVSSWYPQC